MKKSLIILTVLASIIFVTNLGLARMPVPDKTDSWVNDYAGIIDEDTKNYLEDLISSIKQKTHSPVQVIVATFESLEGWDVREFTLEYGRKWRISEKARDNGVVLLVVLNERRVYIGAGQNLKNVLTPPMITDIVHHVIIPEFSQERYSEGIKKAIEIIVRVLNEAKIPENDPVRLIISAIVVLLILILFFIVRHLIKKDK